jgi:hypothetical protein
LRRRGEPLSRKAKIIGFRFHDLRPGYGDDEKRLLMEVMLDVSNDLL